LAANYTLGVGIENLVLGSGGTSGTGNAENNILIGNSVANTLNGGTGNDTLDGGAGVD
jgi:Ca2+-binding RTX toxin-like protein